MNSEVQTSCINLYFAISAESTICLNNSSPFQVELYDRYERTLHHDKAKWPKRQLTVLHPPTRDPTDPILDTGVLNVPHAQGISRGRGHVTMWNTVIL